MKLQILRRCIQVSVILLVMAISVLSLYAHYRSALVIDDEVLMAGLRGETITQVIHPLVESLDDPQTFLDNNKGTVWSMLLMGVSISDPLAAVEALATTKAVHWPLLISIILPVVGTLILGKVFCSWICPGYVLFEVTGKLRRLLRFAEIKPGKLRFAHSNKYVFLVVGIVVAAITSAPLFALIYPPAVISRIIHSWIFGIELAGMVLLMLIMVAFEMFVSPRWWCRTMCPGGALYGLVGWPRLLRVKLAKTGCTGCMECIPVCEAGINPIKDSATIECDNCGVCINHCEPGVLYFSVSLPEKKHLRIAGLNPRGRPRKQRLAARSALLIAGALTLLCVSPASAHHVLGLPHYSYKENYPQRPTLEYPATTGPYDILLTAYPGIPVPGEPANLALYIKNRQTGVVYQDPVTVRILQTSTFGDNRIIMPPSEYQPFDNQPKFQCMFPDHAEYIVELSMMVEGRIEVIPFLMVAGQPTATASIVIAGAVGLVFFFVVIRAARLKRRRRARQGKDIALDCVAV